MRVLLVTAVLVIGLLVASLVCALAGADDTAAPLWQGALVVLGIGLVAFGLRFVPARPLGLKTLDGSAFDDPESFWGRWHRFYVDR